MLVAEEETLGGREGGRWAAQRRPLGGREGSWRFRWEPLGILDSLPGDDFPPGGSSMGGTTLVAQNGSKRTENGCFPEGAGPAPRPDPSPPGGPPSAPLGPV